MIWQSDTYNKLFTLRGIVMIFFLRHRIRRHNATHHFLVGNGITKVSLKAARWSSHTRSRCYWRALRYKGDSKTRCRQNNPSIPII